MQTSGHMNQEITHTHSRGCDIDPDKLLALAAKREQNGQVTLSWAMMLQIVEQLRELYRSEPMVIDNEMAERGVQVYNASGSMRLAIEEALGINDDLRNGAERQRDDDEEAEFYADEWPD